MLICLYDVYKQGKLFEEFKFVLKEYVSNKVVLLIVLQGQSVGFTYGALIIALRLLCTDFNNLLQLS